MEGIQGHEPPLVVYGNNVHTRFHTATARELYTQFSHFKVSCVEYQGRTLSLMLQVIHNGKILTRLPVVVFILDNLNVIKRMLEEAPIAPNYPTGSLEVTRIEVRWISSSFSSIAGMEGKTTTVLTESNLAAVLHMIKQRPGLDSILVTVEDAPNRDQRRRSSLISMEIDESKKASSSSADRSIQNRPLPGQPSKHDNREVPSASTSSGDAAHGAKPMETGSEINRSIDTRFPNRGYQGRLATTQPSTSDDQHQEPLQEARSSYQLSEHESSPSANLRHFVSYLPSVQANMLDRRPSRSLNRAASRASEQVETGRTRRQYSPRSGDDERRRQANQGASGESRDRRRDGSFGETPIWLARRSSNAD